MSFKKYFVFTFVFILFGVNSALADKYVFQKGDSLEKILARFKMLKPDRSNYHEVIKNLKKLNPKLKNLNVLQKDVIVDLGENVSVPKEFQPQEIIEFGQIAELRGQFEKTAEELRRERLLAEARQRERLFQMKRKDLLRKDVYLVGSGDKLWDIIKKNKSEMYSEDVKKRQNTYAKLKHLNPQISKLSNLKLGQELRLDEESDYKETNSHYVKKGDKFWSIIKSKMPGWSVDTIKQRREVYNNVKALNPSIRKFSQLSPGTKIVLKVEPKKLKDEHNLYSVKNNKEKFWDIVKYKRPFEMLGTVDSRKRYYNKIRDLNPQFKGFSDLKEGDEFRLDRFASAHHKTSFIRGGWGMTAFNVSQVGAFGEISGNVVLANRMNIMNHLEKKSWTFDLEIDKFGFIIDGYPELLETSSFQFLIGYKPFTRLKLWGGQTNLLIGMDSNKTPLLKLTSLGVSHTHIKTQYLVLGVRWESCDWYLPGKLLKNFPNYYKAHQKDWKDYKLKKDENLVGYGTRQLTENINWFTNFIKTFHQRAFVGLKVGVGGGVEDSVVQVKEQSAMALQAEYSLHRKLYDFKDFELSLEFLGRYNYRTYTIDAKWGLENGISEIQSHDLNGMVNINIHYDFLGDFLDKVQDGLMSGIKKGFRSGYKVMKDFNPLMDRK